jgi:hypothetical protein
MFVTVNRRIQEKAQIRDRDPVLAYLPRDDEPFEWLVGMFRHNAQLQDLRDLLMARARSGDRVGLSKLADRLIMDAEYVTLTSEEESDDEEVMKHQCTPSKGRHRLVLHAQNERRDHGW